MKNILTILSFFFCCFPVKGQQKVYTIPFTYHNENVLLVRAEVAGQQGVHGFIFDTGGANVLNTHVFGKRADKKPAFVRMGDFQLNEPAFQRDDYSKRFHSEDYHRFGGMLGLEVFKDWVFQIDYNQKVIRVAKNAAELGASVGTKIPLKVEKAPFYTKLFRLMPPYQAWIYLNTDEMKGLRFTLDTGASYGFEQHVNVLKHRNRQSPFLHKVSADTIKGTMHAPYLGESREVEAYEFGLSNARLGVLPVPQLKVMFTPMGSGVVGNAFLRDYLVTVDMENKQIFLKPQPYDTSRATNK